MSKPLLYSVNPKVEALFCRFLEREEQEKTNKIKAYAEKLVAEGKKPERALADALEAYKLGGAVSV